MFPALTLAPHRLHVSQTLLEVGVMSSFMSSSTVYPLALACSLTLLAVSSLTVREYHPLSGVNMLLADTPYKFDRSISYTFGTTGFVFTWFFLLNLFVKQNKGLKQTPATPETGLQTRNHGPEPREPPTTRPSSAQIQPQNVPSPPPSPGDP